MRISPFTPVFFIDRKTDGEESEYIQTFAPTDIITIEILCGPEESPVGRILNACTGAKTQDLTFRNWRANSGLTVYYTRFLLSEGTYVVEIDDIGTSQPFRITADTAELAQTTLIQYTMKDNRQRTDAVFVTPSETIIFYFRVHGGFKDSDWSFSVDSEQYSDEYSNIVQLWGLESTQKRFTMGNPEGVPIWFGELLNRILVCTNVYFDYEQYVRKESNVPEITQSLEGVNSFVFEQTLQKAINIETMDTGAGQVYLRRIDGVEDYRITEDGDQRITIY